MLGLFFAIIVVLVVGLVLLMVTKEYHASKERVTGPPPDYMIQGVDTRFLKRNLHDEDAALDTAFSTPDEFAPRVGTGLHSGFPGIVDKRAYAFADGKV